MEFPVLVYLHFEQDVGVFILAAQAVDFVVYWYYDFETNRVYLCYSLEQYILLRLYSAFKYSRSKNLHYFRCQFCDHLLFLWVHFGPHKLLILLKTDSALLLLIMNFVLGIIVVFSLILFRFIILHLI